MSINFGSYSFILLDDEATLNKTTSLDGVGKVQLWAHDRDAHDPHELMEWFLAPAGTFGEQGQPLLRSSCIQPSPQHPGSLQSGDRDFSANFSATVPEATFVPPSGVECSLPPDAYKPASDCAPKCDTGSLCCQDPKSPPPGACYAVSNCAQLPGPGARGFMGLAAEAFGPPRS